MGEETKKSSSNEMTFFEHIDALRPHLVRAAAVLFIIMIAAFFGNKFVIDIILMSPKSPDFITNRLFCDLSYWITDTDRLCINNIQFNMINTSLGGQFNLQMQVALVTAIVVAVPYLLWELWRFVLPALTEHERRNSRMFVFYVSLCFMVGLSFGYFLIVPLSINFLSGWQASAYITNMIDVKSYLSLVLQVSLTCAAVFQLPLLIYFLTRIGIVSSAFLKKYRRHAVLILAILSMIITPPDLFSMVLVLIPLYSLYELSIWLSMRVERKKASEEEGLTRV